MFGGATVGLGGVKMGCEGVGGVQSGLASVGVVGLLGVTGLRHRKWLTLLAQLNHSDLCV